MSKCVVYQSGGFTNYGISYRKYSQEELAEMGNRAVTGNEKTINILEHMKNLVTVRIFEEEALNRAIKALEEVQQYRKHGVTLESALNNMCDLAAAENLIEEYREIGTLEECRAAMEKQTAKKAITYRDTNRADCPACGATVRGISAPFGNWCSKCGQRLDWEDEQRT